MQTKRQEQRNTTSQQVMAELQDLVAEDASAQQVATLDGRPAKRVKINEVEYDREEYDWDSYGQGSSESLDEYVAPVEHEGLEKA